MPEFPRPDAALLRRCIHCGLCLSACPTYGMTRLEGDSPRGRLRLMRDAAEGTAPSAAFAGTMRFCLDCRACETACPAGVEYGRLAEAAREALEGSPHRLPLLRRLALVWLFRKPWRLALLARLLRLLQRSGLGRLGPMRLLPPLPGAFFAPEGLRLRPDGPVRARVGLHTGCVTGYLFPEVLRDAAAVLVENGCEVVIPAGQGCCGSLAAHQGLGEEGRRLSRGTAAAFSGAGVDAVLVTAAGCGSHLKRHEDPAFREKVRDLTEYLAALPVRPPSGPVPLKVAYHDACHLAHGQGITAQPRGLLDAIPGLARVELAESSWCCGSAGIYNLTHPQAASELLRRKIGHLEATGADVVALCNPGCQLQVRAGLAARGLGMRVAHPVSLLAESYGLKP